MWWNCFDPGLNHKWIFCPIRRAFVFLQLVYLNVLLSPFCILFSIINPFFYAHSFHFVRSKLQLKRCCQLNKQMVMGNSVLVSEVYKVKSMPQRFSKLLWENPYDENFLSMKSNKFTCTGTSRRLSSHLCLQVNFELAFPSTREF